MLKNYRKCIMGCCPAGKERLHSFPKDPTRFAEWVRILGKKPSVKTSYICNRHFSQQYLFGTKLSKYALPNSDFNKVSNPTNIEVSQSVPSPNNPNTHEISNSSELENSSLNLEETFTENDDSPTNANAIDDQSVVNLTEDFDEVAGPDKEVLVTEGLENTDLNDSSSQITALKRALDRCLKQLSEEKTHKKKLKQENLKLSQELENYKKLTANLDSESGELNKHILREVVQFLTHQEEKEKVDKKSIYMIRSTGRYCDVNLINM